jgi:hypothetical protein
MVIGFDARSGQKMQHLTRQNLPSPVLLCISCTATILSAGFGLRRFMGICGI